MNRSISLADFLLHDGSPRDGLDKLLQSYRLTELSRARENIALLAGEPPLTFDFLTIADELLAEVAASPDPDASLNNFERFANSFGSKATLFRYLRDDPQTLAALARLFGFSHFLSEILIRNPEYFDLIGTLRQTVCRESLHRELVLSLGSLHTIAGRRDAMRRFKRRQMLRIGLRDILNLADLPTLMRELSDLADVLIVAAHQLACQEVLNLPLDEQGENQDIPSMSIFALGKLGGRELNYSSDIDLLFVSGQSDDRTTTRIAERTLHNLTAATGEGYLFRVDMRLRPHGGSGPLAPSISSCLAYYESWAEPWEWQSLIKLRHVAGDAELAHRFASFVESLIYAKQMDANIITEIQQVKRRIEQHSLQASGLSDIKTGPGGIRDVEFTVQLLQLIHGTTDSRLRTGNTMEAIEALTQAGQFDRAEGESLKKAYLFLRKLENYLQIVHEFPLHTLPDDPHELDRLARRMGYGGDAPRVALLDELHVHRQQVRRAYLRHFEDLSPVSTPDAEIIANLLSDSGAPAEAEAFLSSYGFADIPAARENLRLLAFGPAHVHVPLRTRRLFLQVAPAILQAVASSPDPDRALNRLESLCSAVGNRASFLRSLARNPHSLQMFATLGAVSEELMQTLLTHPEFLDMLMSPAVMATEKSLTAMLDELRERVAGVKEFEDKLLALRRYRHREMLRIGVRDLMSLADIITIHREIARLAECCVRVALEIVSEQRTELPFARCAIIGLGKLGGEELHYGSDLDIAFVHELGEKKPRPTRLHTFCKGVIEALSEWTAEGFAFKVDTRLRPEGAAGVMTRSLESYEEYWQEWISPWERLALLRVRPVAGDEELGRRFVQRAHYWNFMQPVDEAVWQSICHIKHRVEAERATREPNVFDIKLAPGGLNDIEFTVQWLQLRHGSATPSVLSPNTFEGLERLWGAGILSESEFQNLREAYIFIRRVESRLHLLDPNAPALLPQSGKKLEMLASTLQQGEEERLDGQQLIACYKKHADKVRAIFERRFLGTGH